MSELVKRLRSTFPDEYGMVIFGEAADRIEELEGTGEGETCQRCRRKFYPIVWDAPDWLWEKVTNVKDGSGCYCPDCFSKMAEEKDIKLYWEPCVDHFLRDKLKRAEDSIQEFKEGYIYAPCEWCVKGKVENSELQAKLKLAEDTMHSLSHAKAKIKKLEAQLARTMDALQHYRDYRHEYPNLAECTIQVIERGDA